MPTPKRRKPAPAATRRILQLKIVLRDTKHPVWRTVQVAGDVTLRQLHAILQLTMGWESAHLHEFRVDGVSYGEPSDEFDTDVKDERRVRLAQVASEAGASLTYLYDFGDGWEHDVIVEKNLPPEPRVRYPLCLEGEGACPPEDVGGAWGYDEFLAAIHDPSNEQHDEMLEWVGGAFDPGRFDVRATNEAFDRFGPFAR
ncbi:MAG: plasmid pRiA4b ORF-3 family protein [Chloroflexi bacterium]|nr:plasmid pRiA4b ORF-3 family protein [Chloroflexota bacterium]